MGRIKINNLEKKLNFFVLIWTLGDILLKIFHWAEELDNKYKIIHFAMRFLLEHRVFMQDFVLVLIPVAIVVVFALYMSKKLFLLLIKKGKTIIA